MPRQYRILPVLLVFFFAIGAANSQEKLPPQNVPLRQPSQIEIDQHLALHHFAQGVLFERQDRLLEAVRAYEAAAKLDPKAVTIQKSLLSTYISVERIEDASNTVKKVLELDPSDYEVSYLYARQLRAKGKLAEACEVLQRGLKSPELRYRAHAHQQMECDLGILYERLAKYREAAAAFARAAAILDHPESLEELFLGSAELQARSAELHERTGRNYLEVGDFDGAAKAFRRAQERFPAGAFRLYFHLAQISLRQGKLDEAESSLREYLKTMPQGMEAYEMLIGVLRKLKRDAEIVPLLEQATSRDAFNVSLRLLMARQLAQAGQVKKAESTYLALADAGPSEAIFRDLFLLYKSQHPRGAQFIAEFVNDAITKGSTPTSSPLGNPVPIQVRAMITALRDNQDLAREVVSAAAKSEQKQLHLETLQVFAAISDRLEMLPQSEFFYRQCLKQPLPVAVEPLIYGGALRVMWKSRNYSAIVEVCRDGLNSAQPNNRVLLRASLAEALAQLQNWDEAIREVDQAVADAVGGDRFKLRLVRCRLLMQSGKAAAAENECLEMLKDHQLPGEILEVRYLLAGVYSASQRMPLAEQQLAECLKIDPDSVAVNNDLGFHWADQNKNLQEAEAMIRNAVDLDRKNRQRQLFPPTEPVKEFQDNACYIDSLGWVLFRQGKLEAACKELQYATTLPDGDDPVIWDHLGDVYRALGRLDQALTAWRQAIHFYEQGNRRKMDDRYRALQEKLKTSGGM